MNHSLEGFFADYTQTRKKAKEHPLKSFEAMTSVIERSLITRAELTAKELFLLTCNT